MNVLVINSGSSSIKYLLFEMQARTAVADGLLERIGEDESVLIHHERSPAGSMVETRERRAVADHRAALAWILDVLHERLGDDLALSTIGHRVVHGGERFQQPVRIDRTVIEDIRAMIPLAPLHNPANLMGIEVAMAVSPDTPQVAVFDTAFHHTLPAHAHRYAVPEDLYRRHSVRRFGFHGTSHEFVSRRAAEHLGRSYAALSMITLHLGNGASAAAIAGGRCVDTSMGMTPLEGLVMGTRSGDVDPALHFYLMREAGHTAAEVETLLNRASGLLGLCGQSDMREVERRCAQGDARCELALEIYCYRVKKTIGAYYAALGGVDALVFTAGIGENSAGVRARVCEGLERLGIVIDDDRNRQGGDGIFEIQTEVGEVAVLVVPTDEELAIAEQAYALVGA